MIWVLPLLFSAATHASPPVWNVRTETLPNGLQVVLNRDSRLPLVAIHLRLGIGAASDPPDRPGRAHLAEHLAFPDGDAVTTHDAMAFSWIADPEGVAAILDEIDGRLSGTSPPPSASAVASQASVAAWEARGWVNGDLRARMRSLALYPPGHPYRAPAAGTEAGLALWGVDPQGVRTFLEGAFQTAAATIVLSGDLDDVELGDRLRFRPSQAAAKASPPLPAPHVGRYTEISGASTPELVAVWPTVPSGDPDEPALDLVASLLLRDPHLRHASAFTLNRVLAGELVVSLPALRPGAPLRLSLRGLDRALRDLRRHPPTAADLAAAAAPWERWADDVGEGLEERAALLADCLARAGIADCRAWEVARHTTVTPDQISAALERYLSPDRALLLSLVPPGEEALALPARKLHP